MTNSTPPAVVVTGVPTTIGERIVVVVDGGPTGHAAVRWVTDRLGRRPAAVRIVGTVSPDDEDAVVAARRKDTEDDAAVVRTVAPHASVASDVVVGDPADVLCVEADSADILVVGTGAGDSRRRGALPEQLAARASCVVVVVPVDWAPGDGTTVVGASIDAASDAALDFAKDHARREGRGLQVVSSAAEQGDPAEVLRAAADDAELLVVGRRTRGPVTRLLLGSVSRALVQDPPCPVAVVPQPRVPLRLVGDSLRDAVL